MDARTHTAPTCACTHKVPLSPGMGHSRFPPTCTPLHPIADFSGDVQLSGSAGVQGRGGGAQCSWGGGWGVQHWGGGLGLCLVKGTLTLLWGWDGDGDEEDRDRDEDEDQDEGDEEGNGDEDEGEEDEDMDEDNEDEKEGEDDEDEDEGEDEGSPTGDSSCHPPCPFPALLSTFPPPVPISTGQGGLFPLEGWPRM